MAEKHPFHADDSFVSGDNALQEFVDPPHEVTDEERNRPRYGRPVRKPSTDTPAPEPKPSAE